MIIGIVAAVALIVVGLGIFSALNTRPTTVPISTSVPETESSFYKDETSDNQLSFLESDNYESSVVQSSHNVARSYVSIPASISNNMANNGIVAWDNDHNNIFYVDNDFHTLYYCDSANQIHYLFQDCDGEFTSLYYLNNRLYFVYDHTAFYMDYLTENDSHDISTLSSYAGTIYSLYVTNSYYYIYSKTDSNNGSLYRIYKSYGDMYECLTVKNAHSFIFVDEMLYYLSTDSKNRSSVFRIKANDFSKNEDGYIYLNSGEFNFLASDGSNIYALYKSNNIWIIEKYNLSLTTTGTSTWNLSDIVKNNGSVEAFNIINNHAFVTVKDNNKLIYKLDLNANGTYSYNYLDTNNSASPDPNIIPFSDKNFKVCFIAGNSYLNYCTYDSNENAVN